MQNKINGAIILGFCFLIVFGIMNTCSNKNMFDDNGGYDTLIQGIVINIIPREGNGIKRVIVYEFEYNGKTYRSSNSGVRKKEFNSLAPLDSIPIMINHKFPYPQYSKILFDYNKNDFNGK